MKNKRIMYGIMLLVLILGSAFLVYLRAGNIQHSPVPVQETTPPVQETISLHLRERFSLEEDDILTILDVRDDRIFVEIYRDYPYESPYFREVGYSSYTTHLFIYDWIIDSVVYECELPPGGLCTDGVLLDGEQWAYVVLDPQDAGMSYNIQVICENLETGQNVVYTSATNDSTDYYIPELIPLADQSFAFSYCDSQNPKDFGVCAVSPKLQVTKIYEPPSNARFIGTELRGNGSEFVYYVSEDNRMTLVVGDNHSEITKVYLEENTKMDSFFLLGNQIGAFVRRDIPGASPTDEVCTWGFDSNVRISQSASPLFRLAWAGGNQAIGLDMSYRTFWMSDRGDSIQIEKLDIPQEDVMFYQMNEQNVLAYLRDSDTIITFQF